MCIRDRAYVDIHRVFSLFDTLGREAYILSSGVDNTFGLRHTGFCVPVSYTHLDVYKRQIMNSPVFIVSVHITVSRWTAIN